MNLQIAAALAPPPLAAETCSLMQAAADPFVLAVRNRLRSLIRAGGYSVSALERAMELEDNYIRQALNGGKRLTLELVAQVCRFLGADPAALLAGDYPATREGEHFRIGEPRPAVAYGERVEGATTPAITLGVTAADHPYPDPTTDPVTQLMDGRTDEELVSALARALIRRGVISPDDLR